MRSPSASLNGLYGMAGNSRCSLVHLMIRAMGYIRLHPSRSGADSISNGRRSSGPPIVRGQRREPCVDTIVKKRGPSITGDATPGATDDIRSEARGLAIIVGSDDDQKSLVAEPKESPWGRSP